MGTKRILGNDRFLMMLCRDARRRWMQYGENRKTAKKIDRCEKCKKQKPEEWDHIEPLGPRPRRLGELPVWLSRMINDPCQALCKECHLQKTKLERQRKVK